MTISWLSTNFTYFCSFQLTNFVTNLTRNLGERMKGRVKRTHTTVKFLIQLKTAIRCLVVSLSAEVQRLRVMTILCALRGRSTRCAQLKRRSAELHIFGEARGRFSSIWCILLMAICINWLGLPFFHQAFSYFFSD